MCYAHWNIIILKEGHENNSRAGILNWKKEQNTANKNNNKKKKKRREDGQIQIEDKIFEWLFLLFPSGGQL
jgi:hypothetical protein